MTRHLTIATLALLAALSPRPAQALPNTLALSADATQVTFLLKGNTHDVHGSLRMESGRIRFDDESGEAEGRILLNALSAASGNARRDRKMHGKVLLSDRFAEIRLDVTGLDGKVLEGSSEVQVKGALTLLGEAHEIEFPARLEREGAVLKAEADLLIPYVEWGLTDPSMFVFRVDKEVTVHISLEGLISQD